VKQKTICDLKTKVTMIFKNFVLANNNNITNHGNDSMHQENNEDLFISNRPRYERKEFECCNESLAPGPCTIQDNANEHAIGTCSYFLAMIMISNMLASCLRIFYR